MRLFFKIEYNKDLYEYSSLKNKREHKFPIVQCLEYLYSSITGNILYVFKDSFSDSGDL